MKKSSSPSVYRGAGFSGCSLAIPGGGCFTLLFPLIPARAFCFGRELRPWFGGVGGPECTPSPYMSHLQKE